MEKRDEKTDGKEKEQSERDRLIELAEGLLVRMAVMEAKRPKVFGFGRLRQHILGECALYRSGRQSNNLWYYESIVNTAEVEWANVTALLQPMSADGLRRKHTGSKKFNAPLTIDIITNEKGQEKWWKWRTISNKQLLSYVLHVDDDDDDDTNTNIYALVRRLVKFAAKEPRPPKIAIGFTRGVFAAIADDLVRLGTPGQIQIIGTRIPNPPELAHLSHPTPNPPKPTTAAATS